MSDDITDRVLDLASGVFDVAPDALGRQSTAADVEGWDSLAQLSLLVAIEDEFGLVIDPGDVAELPDLGALADFVAARLG